MPLYDERLAVPRWWWLLVPAVGLAVATLMLAFGPVPAAVALAVTSCAAAAGLHVYGSSRILVTGGALTAGRIRIPVEALGLPEILDEEEAFAWRTRRADPHALMLLRGYVPTAVRIEIKDRSLGAPYLYLSTRRPMTLVAILAFTRQ
ncbi:DUF3093 domain-containing protein [Streptomyces capparidis]|jgi:hypothetical protein